MTVFLSAFGGAGWQFFDNNGVILSGGKIYTYAAGTTTPATTYTDKNGNTPHTNPIILNSTGRIATGEIWLSAGKNYKFVLTTSTDVLLGTFDNVSSTAVGSGTVGNFSGNGTQTTFTLPSAPIDTNSTNIFINGVYQQKNTYSVAGSTLTFSEAPPINSTIEANYF